MQEPTAWMREAAAMVRSQLADRGINDPRVLQAMTEVPRHLFVPADQRDRAWADEPLPIAAGQTISQPYIVARMAELAALRPDDHVLEVGAGSGYAAAVLARLAAGVIAIERHEVLAEAARERLACLGYGNVTVICADGSRGWPEEAPYAAIVVSAGGPVLPQPLLDQLAIGGRLVIPLGPLKRQMLTLVRRTSPKSYVSEECERVQFVPLVTREKGL